MVEKQFNQGDVIFREGEYGETFYQILEGSVKVVLGLGEPDEQVLTELKAGDYFGEMAVLEGYRRSASVVALGEGAKVMEITASELGEFFRDDPSRVEGLVNRIGDRIRTLTADYDEVKKFLDENTPIQDEGLLARIKRVFKRPEKRASKSDLTYEEINHSAGFAKHVEEVKKGMIIFREGDHANCMFDIHWGRVGIYTGYNTANEHMIAELGVNQFFGEMGLLGKEPRSATAVALEEGTTLETITMADLEELLEKNPSKVYMIVQHLSYRLRRLTEDYTEACEKIYGKL